MPTDGNGTGRQAIFGNAFASALDGAGNIYVADTTNFARTQNHSYRCE